MVFDKRQKKGGWRRPDIAKPRTSSPIVPRQTGGSPRSVWEWWDWLQPKERKKNNNNATKHIRVNMGLWRQMPYTEVQTLHMHTGRCFLQPLFFLPPQGIVGSAYVRKAKRTITPQCASVLPGWATRSVFPRPPAAQCPGSLHMAGGTSPRKLLVWWRKKRVISFCFRRGWREKKGRQEERSQRDSRAHHSSWHLTELMTFLPLQTNGEQKTQDWTGRYWGFSNSKCCNPALLL